MDQTPASSLAMPRRRFITLSGLSIAAAAFNSFPVMAGPFASSEFEKLIPPDKKLTPEWVTSLYARGERTVYSKKRNELKYIGMPIGGITCGTLYLGGDGHLWLWDIFNQNSNGIAPRSVPFNGYGVDMNVDPQNGANYVSPADSHSAIQQGFAVNIDGVTKNMNEADWENVEFIGEYPLATITYSDPACPVNVSMVAYSPFVPLNVDDSCLPATIFEITLKNTGAKPVNAELAGWLQNVCSMYNARPESGHHVNSAQKNSVVTSILSSFDGSSPEAPQNPRPDIVVDDFQRATYEPWKTEGTAFGNGPTERKKVPAYQGDLGGIGDYVVNSHTTAPGATVEEKDKKTGKLIGPPFTIDRKYISFWIGGGSNVDQVGLRLLVDGKVVRRAAGHNENKMTRTCLDVTEFQGKQAFIEIYDEGTAGWGNLGVGSIHQTDVPTFDPPSAKDPDYGTMALAMLGNAIPRADANGQYFAAENMNGKKRVGNPLVGSICQSVKLASGKTKTFTCIIAWNFPNANLGVDGAKEGNYYSKRFKDAKDVTDYIAKNYIHLSKTTHLWHDTWNDTTVAHWFMNRTFANTSILATSTAHRFGNGRFWGWEGIGCCYGTCTHVWHYAQAMGRIFPELERDMRERVDFGVALDHKTGEIHYRGEGSGPAIDGQCGRILGVLREHQMSSDNTFLKKVWSNVKLAMDFLSKHDSDGDGLLEGAQDNTLDAAWFGKISWISSLYAAALMACSHMAEEMAEPADAAKYKQMSERTGKAIDDLLFNGDYYYQRPEAGHDKSLGTYKACHIDQVHGQSWAWQVGLGRILDKQKTITALKSLYRYNFVLDVGPFRRKHKPGRPYAIAGDAGLIMATNPSEIADAFGNANDWQYGYFNECMSGFEHQAASHMIAEGLVTEGLAVTRAIHDRYHASRRNPYNEVECSDHYSRAMASYGSFISLCGFTSNGPKGQLGFEPRITPDNFRAPFTCAGGWGTYSQKKVNGKLQAEITVRYGKVHVSELTLTGEYSKATSRAATNPIKAAVTMKDGRPVVKFAADIILLPGNTLSVNLG